MKINFCQYENYREQMKAEQLAWHLGNNPKLSDEKLETFKAGFDSGWRQLLSALKLHDQLKVE